MSFNFTEIYEKIRIKNGKMRINIMTATGKDGDYFVMISPSLLVSGYGSTQEEAQESFKENIRLFCSDLLALSSEQRNVELKKLGFMPEKFHTKNFSKAYVDENGVLQGLETGSVKAKMLEAAL